jgi:hypothetical protein
VYFFLFTYVRHKTFDYWQLRWKSIFEPGTDVMIFKIFSLKNFAKKFAFFAQNKAKLCNILIITLVFEKNANFFAENCRKSQKIVIITSTPGKVYVFSQRQNKEKSRLLQFRLTEHSVNLLSSEFSQTT